MGDGALSSMEVGGLVLRRGQGLILLWALFYALDHVDSE